jgi:predicted Zn-dependent protease
LRRTLVMMDAVPWLFLIPPILVTILALGTVVYGRTAAGRARRHLGDGGRAIYKGEADLAEREFRAGLTLMPRHPALLGALGSLLTSRERYQDALPLIEAARRADPGDLRLQVLVGRCHQGVGDDRAATTAWTKIPVTSQQYLDAQVLLAQRSEAQGDLGAAVQFLEAGIDASSRTRARPYHRDLHRLKSLLEERVKV